MRNVVVGLGLSLLLLVAQQGAVLHELSHVRSVANAEVHVDTSQPAKICELCLAFSQLSNPVAPSVHVPLTARAVTEATPEPLYSAIAAAIPTPRSRGPPVLS